MVPAILKPRASIRARDRKNPQRSGLHQDEALGSSPTGLPHSSDIDPLSSSDFVVVYSSMALFQIEPELNSTGGLGVAMFAKDADEFITGSSATVFA